MTQRPNDECPVDRRNEAKVAEQLLQRWNCNAWHKLRGVYQLDLALLRQGDVRFFAEVKCRKPVNYGQGDGYSLSLSKVLMARQLMAVTGRPTIFVCWLGDGGMYWRNFEPAQQHRIKIFGRADIPANHEPCVVFPWDTFACLSLNNGPPEVWSPGEAA